MPPFNAALADVGPPSPRQAVREDAVRRSPAKDSTGRRLLLAEDEAAVRAELAELLADAGFDIVGKATSADQAVAMASALRPDAALMDLTMPKNGLQAATEIVQQHDTPVVVLTTGVIAGPELVRGALEAGVMAVVARPFTKERLVPAIELAVARRAETRALRAQIADVAERLDSRKVIERAKGMLMVHQQMTEPEAFRFIQRTAMDHRTSMRIVAYALIERLSGAAATGRQD